jgi:Hg(II)-responsive transcriptional regulator
MRIGEAAKAAGVGVETIRYYERQGIVPQPPRPKAGRGVRQYPQETIEQIRFVREAQQLGFSLREIQDLMSLQSHGGDCGAVRAQASDKLAEVNRKIERLAEIKVALEDLIRQCPGRGGLRRCSILQAMQRSEDHA